MVAVWQIYQSDLGLTYPMLTVNIINSGEIVTDIDLFTLLPTAVINQKLEVKSSCLVPDLTPRKIRLYLSDDSIYELSYPISFDSQLFNNLSNSINVRAFELIGETIRYSRLRRMLNRGS